MIKLCVFDMDGTLVNSIGEIASACNYALEKNGFPAKEIKEYYSFVGLGVSVLIERALGKKSGTPLFDKVLSDFLGYYNEHLADLTYVYDGIDELLSAARERKIACAVYSNKTESVLKKVTYKFFKEFPFVSVIGIVEGRPCKPDAGVLLSLMDELSVSKNEVLYIGDSDVDLMTAKNAGVKCLSAGWGFCTEAQLKAAGAEKVYVRPQDMIPMLDAKL